LASALLFLAWGSLRAQQLAPAPVPVPDTLAQRVLACTPCHGREGRATNAGYFPRIAGKPPGYLFEQLLNFREGRRTQATMNYLVEHLDDAYLREIAGYFGTLELPYPPPQPAAVPADELARGEALAQRGDRDHRIPACVQCHGQKLTGVAPAFPGLLGLPRDYLIGQFGNWRTGLRHARAPDCMHEVAQRLSATDIAAVASWLAAQPLPADPRPAPPSAAPLPLDCGSGRQ
jgi:cytochrome c553